MMKNTIWTDEQDNFLRANYPAKLIAELCALLGRTESAVESRLQRLGLARKEKWTLEQVGFLRKNYSTMSTDGLVKAIGKNLACIQRKASMLGIKRGKSAIRKSRDVAGDKPIKGLKCKKKSSSRKPVISSATSRKKKVIAPNRWDRKKLKTKVYTNEGKKAVRIDSKTVIMVPANFTEDQIEDAKITYELSRKRNQFSL